MIILKCNRCGASTEVFEKKWLEQGSKKEERLRISCNSCGHYLPAEMEDLLLQMVNVVRRIDWDLIFDSKDSLKKKLYFEQDTTQG